MIEELSVFAEAVEQTNVRAIESMITGIFIAAVIEWTITGIPPVRFTDCTVFRFKFSQDNL